MEADKYVLPSQQIHIAAITKQTHESNLMRVVHQYNY